MKIENVTPGPRIKYGAGFDPGSRGFRTLKGHWIPACAGMTALGALIGCSELFCQLRLSHYHNEFVCRSEFAEQRTGAHGFET